MPPRFPHRRRRRGFTLVEVMLAIGILSLAIAAIYATWTAILRATKAARVAAEEAQRARIALRCLEESLTYAQMYVANINQYAFVAENGSDALLTFVTRLPESFPRSGRFGGVTVRRVAYQLEPGPNNLSRLVLRQAPLLTEFDEDERNYPLVLMENVRRMEMFFWDERKRDWVDEWAQTNQMPRIIRVSIITANPRSPGQEAEEFTRIVAPATVAVQPFWQGVGGAPGTGRPGAPGLPVPGQPVPGQPMPPGQPGQPVNPVQPVMPVPRR
ncbi:MAG: prepilin-type N-terminal cleavage/methylation domain-containing protein [Limisphaerales bacterium]